MVDDWRVEITRLEGRMDTIEERMNTHHAEYVGKIESAVNRLLMAIIAVAVLSLGAVKVLFFD